ncbi:MAG: hypothetical protein RR248_02240 [Clostridia bacterium]
MKTFTAEQKRLIGLKFVIENICPTSPYGIERLKRLSVFSRSQIGELNCELDNLKLVVDNYRKFQAEFEMLAHLFSQSKYILRSIKRCASLQLDEVELFEFKEFLLLCKKIITQFNIINQEIKLNLSFADTTKPLEILDKDGSGIPTFYIEDTSSPELEAVRKQKRAIEKLIKQNLKTPSNMQELINLSVKEMQIENVIKASLCQKLIPYLGDIEYNCNQIARLDLLIAKAVFALKYPSSRPQIDCENLKVVDMTNPQISDLLQQRGQSFTPLAICIGSGVTVVTGANMGGKSVFIQTITLNVILAHLGCYVFAKKFETPFFDFFSFISCEQEQISKGLSGFGTEIVNLNFVYRQAKKEVGFIVFDEFARSTNAGEAQTIFSAVVKTFNQNSSFVLMTTHLDNVADEAKYHYQVIGLDKDKIKKMRLFDQEQGIEQIAGCMNYGLVKVDNIPLPKDAITICKLLGLDSDILSKIEP